MIMIFLGSFDPIIKLFTPFLKDAVTFLQAVAVLGATAMAMFYKIRQMFATAQEDQMWDKKTKDIFVALVVVFITPTIISVLQSYFFK